MTRPIDEFHEWAEFRRSRHRRRWGTTISLLTAILCSLAIAAGVWGAAALFVSR